MVGLQVIVAVCMAGLCLSACSERDGDRGGGGDGSETSGDACADGRDNDGDGLVDCDDPACGAYAWCGGGGSDGGGSTDAGTRPDTGPPVDGGPTCAEPLDVVFVIDVSTSMADEVEQIRAGMDSIWAAASSLTSNTQFGLVVFVDDVVAVSSCAPFASKSSMQTEFEEWRAFTSSNAQPGGGASGNTDCPENSLDALHTAATVCPWRDGATHIAIHVTDDTFAERPATLSGSILGDGIDVQHTYAETVSALQENMVRVGAFAAPTGEFCGAGTSSDTARGFLTPYMGMDSIPDATGGRAWSIRDVRSGTLDMAEAINEFTEDEYCTLY